MLCFTDFFTVKYMRRGSLFFFAVLYVNQKIFFIQKTNRYNHNKIIVILLLDDIIKTGDGNEVFFIKQISRF